MHSALIYRLLYSSENRIGGGEMLQRQAMRNILSRARAINQRCGVTGALIYNDRYFAQVIEGEHDSVQTVFERIQCDPRHGNIAVLSIEQSNERAFGEWSMNFLGDSTDALARFKTLTGQSATPSELPRKQLISVLQHQLSEIALTKLSS